MGNYLPALANCVRDVNSVHEDGIRELWAAMMCEEIASGVALALSCAPCESQGDAGKVFSETDNIEARDCAGDIPANQPLRSALISLCA